MTDEQIIKAVRDGTHTLVPMPIGKRKFFIGRTREADIPADHYGLILDLDPNGFEGEEVGGCMMGSMTSNGTGEWNITDARAGKYRALGDDKDDDAIPF